MTRALDHQPGEDILYAKVPSGGLANPFRFVKLSPTIEDVAQCDTAGEFADGVIEEPYTIAGESADIIQSGIVWIELGGTVADKAEVATDSVGRAVTAVAGNCVLGTMIKGGSIGKLGALRLRLSKDTGGAGATVVAVGTSAALSGTPGSITISTTAVKTGDKIFLSRNTSGGTLGNLKAPAASIVDGTSFVINSDANETSTVNWMIVR
jgi:hypothetical protein